MRGALAAFAWALAHAQPITVVDLQGAPPPATVLAVQVCAGLMNRSPALSGFAYTLMHPEDSAWLAIVQPAAPAPTPIAPFLARCLATPGLAAGYILYNFSAQQVTVPNLLTLAAVLDAVPLEPGSPYLPPALPLAYDALAQWANWSALQATAFMFAAYANRTSTLAKMNPGLDVHAHPLDPPLTLLPDLSLADFIVSQRLFNFFLAQGCIPGTPEHALMEAMAQRGPWPRPIAVYGYDDTLPLFGGDTFEAETNCVAEHSMGQIASTGVNNLAFFAAHAPPLTEPLLQPPPTLPPGTPFNASASYVTLVVGDGDNLAMVKSSRFAWFQARVSACAGPQAQDAGAPAGAGAAAAGASCYPLSWTLSPALQRDAPELARWYFAGAARTQRDYFVLPPSGHLYSYPGSLQPGDAQAFVRATESDAALYNASATVDWEWVGTWARTIANFTPRYAERGVITALFAVNVPYLLPIAEFGVGEEFKVVGGRVVLFQGNEWRGDSGAAAPGLHPFLRNASEVAAGLLGAPRGTVSAIYLTSDGGGSVAMLDALAALLQGTHVQIVDAGTQSRMAIASQGRGGGGGST